MCAGWDERANGAHVHVRARFPVEWGRRDACVLPFHPPPLLSGSFYAIAFLSRAPGSEDRFERRIKRTRATLLVVGIASWTRKRKKLPGSCFFPVNLLHRSLEFWDTFGRQGASQIPTPSLMLSARVVIIWKSESPGRGWQRATSLRISI